MDSIETQAAMNNPSTLTQRDLSHCNQLRQSLSLSCVPERLADFCHRPGLLPFTAPQNITLPSITSLPSSNFYPQSETFPQVPQAQGLLLSSSALRESMTNIKPPSPSLRALSTSPASASSSTPQTPSSVLRCSPTSKSSNSTAESLKFKVKVEPKRYRAASSSPSASSTSSSSDEESPSCSPLSPPMDTKQDGLPVLSIEQQQQLKVQVSALVRERAQKRIKNPAPLKGRYVENIIKTKPNPHGYGACHICGVLESTEWRRDSDGKKSLCNACGLFYYKLQKKFKDSQLAKNGMAPPTKNSTKRAAK